ncbi:MAG: 50S ribosomal protein L9 [Firmicutes bacterium]|nr:50S ribosomal protein L9 [Bacillota bacterium]
MKVLLRKDLAGKGKAGEIINVNDGYGKNFVIKNGYGVLVTNEIEAQVKAKSESDTFRISEEKKQIAGIIKKLEDAEVTIIAKIGDNGKLFGSITGGDIEKALVEKGFEIEKRNIVLPEPIKAIGIYKVKVKFSYGMAGEIKVNVVNQ